MKVHEYDSGPTLAPQRGEALGRRYAREISLSSSAYRSYFADRGLDSGTVDVIAKAAGEAVTEWCPKLSDEIVHIARGAGLTFEELLTLNARTEIFAGLPEAPAPVEPLADEDDPLTWKIPGLYDECTTVCYVPPSGKGQVLSLQTWDWSSWLAPTGLLNRFALKAGGSDAWLKTFAEPGQLAKIGLSSRGLSVHLNMLRHQSDTGDGGVPIHVILRRILEDASTLDEAIDIARSAKVSASSAITVVATGSDSAQAAALEISPAGVAVVHPDETGWLVHTNHFLDPDLAEGGVVSPASTTHERYDDVRGRLDVAMAMEGLVKISGRLIGDQGSGAPICAKEDPALPQAERHSTLLTIKLHPGIGYVEYLAGSPADVVAAGATRRC